MDEYEYRRCVELYLDDVKRVALSGCGNEQDAEDITQTVFLKLLKCKVSFEDEEHRKKWLIRVAVNECHSLWRSPWRSRVDYFVPERSVSGKRTSLVDERVKEAILQLKSNYREVIFLFYYEDYSTREIAEILGISEASVLKRLQRARDKIRALLEHKAKESY